jgi:hypothetical protein
MQHIISKFELIKEMQMVNAVMASIFGMAMVF